MSDKSWTVAVLNDLIAVLSDDRYKFARYQLTDAIESIERADDRPNASPDGSAELRRLH
ncbi:MAG: hypothetical protein AAGK92_11535 [Pseudomonadota bacterium]